MKFIPVCLFAAGFAAAHAQYPGAEPIPELYKKGVESITIADAQAYLGYLAGPECEGRGTLQPGYLKAAKFVADHFKQYGLKPVGQNGSYFQMVHFARTALKPGDSMLASADGKTKYAGEGEIAFGSLSQNADVSADAVFLRLAGAEAHVPATAKLDGKIVFVVADRFPASLRSEVAARHPLAIVQVMDDVVQGSGSAQRPVAMNLTRISINRAAARKLAGAAGIDAEFIDGKSTATEAKPGHGKVKLVAKFAETDAVDVPNVVGFLPGSDPKLKDEIIGLGAHLDHVGKRGDTVYPGADDDGSGSTALIAVVKAFHDSGVKPRRGLLFMNFCGEEMGLLGSAWYSDHPIFPHDKMIAELQMDMVGRDSNGVQNGDRNRVDKLEDNIDTIRLVGSKRISTDLDKAIADDNKYIGFKFKWDAEDVYTRSDHYNFAKRGIPIAFLFDGFHPDYHQATDTVDKIDWVKLTNSAKLYYIVALDLANRAERPRKDVPQAAGG